MKTEKPTYGNIRIGNIIVKFETTNPITPNNPEILAALSTISQSWQKLQVKLAQDKLLAELAEKAKS
jgi:hypothetical protein